MKTFLRTGMILALLTASAAANAGWSANIGWQSDYYFRGIFQKSSSAQGGVDYESGGFYVGVWAADVVFVLADCGIEREKAVTATQVDFLVGVVEVARIEVAGVADPVGEVARFAAIAEVTIDFEAVAGESATDIGGPTLDYEFYTLTAEYNGFWGQYGTFQNDFDGDYWQFGYDTTVADFDVGLSLLLSDETLVGTSEEALIFSISKTFDIK